jgi:hypothetical protein
MKQPRINSRAIDCGLLLGSGLAWALIGSFLL